MDSQRACGARPRGGRTALAAALVAGLAGSPLASAWAQSPSQIELAQVSSLTLTGVSLIKALPQTTAQEVYEAQLAAAIEASGLSGSLATMALEQMLKVPGLPPAAVAAIRSLLAKGARRSLDTAALAIGGPGFGGGLGGGGGGGSDY